MIKSGRRSNWAVSLTKTVASGMIKLIIGQAGFVVPVQYLLNIGDTSWLIEKGESAKSAVYNSLMSALTWVFEQASPTASFCPQCHTLMTLPDVHSNVSCYRCLFQCKTAGIFALQSTLLNCSSLIRHASVARSACCC